MLDQAELRLADTGNMKSAPRTGMSRKRREAFAAYVFLIPWLLGAIGLTIGPMAASLYLSFTNYDLLGSPVWIGMKNYADLMSDPRYLHSIQVTLVYVALSVPLKLAFALLLAVLLNRGVRGVNAYRAIYYVPSLLGGSVAIAILWRQLFATEGVVNKVLNIVGWQHPPSWLTNPHFSLYTLVLLAIWEFGAPMIIFLAGLRQIPADLYEAARVDGAGTVAQFLRITIPLLTPMILFNLVLQIIGAFQAFTPAYIISNGSGGPLDSTLFYTLYLYQQEFGSLHMGYGSAMAWLLLVVIGAFTGAVFYSSKYWVFYSDRSR